MLTGDLVRHFQGHSSLNLLPKDRVLEGNAIETKQKEHLLGLKVEALDGIHIPLHIPFKVCLTLPHSH